MNNIVYKKFNALRNIFNSYEIYKGNIKSMLEIQIHNLKDKLSEEDYNNLIMNFEEYKNHIFNILANTQRVFIKLNENERQEDFSSFDSLLEELPKSEE